MAASLGAAGLRGPDAPHDLPAGDGSGSAVQRIRGGQYKIATVPLQEQGWRSVDEMHRAFAGQPWSGYLGGVHLVTAKTIDFDGGPKNLYGPDDGYRDACRKVWSGKQGRGDPGRTGRAVVSSPSKPNAYRISLAPEKLWQSIDLWPFCQQGARFGFVNIDLGQTVYPEVEPRVLDEVGSYGKQIGRIGDARDVPLRPVDLGELDRRERDAVAILQGQITEVRQVKRRGQASEAAD